MKFELNENPIAKKRHRHGQFGTYDPQFMDKRNCKWKLAKQARESNFDPLEGPVFAKIEVKYPMPATWSKKRKKEMQGKYVATKPDNDNYEKFYFDVLNGIAYKDDAQIAKNETSKVYDYEGSVKIQMEIINE